MGRRGGAGAGGGEGGAAAAGGRAAAGAAAADDERGPLRPTEKSASGIREALTGVPVVSSSVVAVELDASDSESGLQEKKTVSAEAAAAVGPVVVVVVAGGFLGTRHSFFFAAAQLSASSRDRGKTAMETPAGEQSLAGPSGKKGSGDGAEEEEVAAATAEKQPATTTTAIMMARENAPSILRRRGLPPCDRGRGMARESLL